LSRYFKAQVIGNFPLNDNNNLLTLRPLEPVIGPKPGQFYMIEVSDSYDPILKRPFCCLRRTPETLQFLYTVRGKGTALMREFRKEHVINIIGPLGNGYPEPPEGYTPVVIAGGTGIVSLFSLIEKNFDSSYVIYGAKTKDDLLMLNELGKQGIRLTACTDDCSYGEDGKVNEIFMKFLTSHESLHASCMLYVCGPRPMLKKVAGIARDYGIKGYASLEENMACGFGACLGCSVKTVHGYQRVCKEGPVFPLEEIEWI
jgi:dihydroorotate dehydrogenase electron transfer subunit